MKKRVWVFAATLALGVAAIAATGATASFGGASVPGSTSLHAAPFNWSAVPKTVAARQAKSTLVFGMEQDVTGFNTLQADENAFWAAITGITPVVRGTYINDQNAAYHLDLAKSVIATKKDLTINIRPDAYWMWGTKKVPVTGADFAYTWKQLVDPKNNVASAVGYSNISGYTLKGSKTIIFHWKPGQPFADYRDLFAPVLPGFALTGQDFNTYWSNCVCGNDGKPISDGPFYVANYTKGQGMTLKPNPYWYGTKPGLKEIDFKLITDTNSEIQAMRGGEVDAIAPSPQTALASLVHQSGLVYSSIQAYYQEHWDIQVGSQGNPLLRQPWMRQALALGMARSALVKALYSQIAPGLKQLQNPWFNLGADALPLFAKYNYAPKKAIALLKAHCTGGPSKPTAGNSSVWTCGGTKTEFRFNTTAGNQRRQTSAAIFQSQLGAIGIKLDVSFLPASNFFGSVLPSHNFDIGEYAWVGGPDPSGFDAIYQCADPAKNLGGQNYKLYCNKNVDKLIAAGETELNPVKRSADYRGAAAIVSNDIAIIPLYSQPSILVYKTQIKGMNNSNNPTLYGPTWNAELWHW